MYHTSILVTTITADRIRAAETARRGARIDTTEPAAPRRSRRLRTLATRIAAPGLR